MIWTRLAACAGLLGVLVLAPPTAHGDEKLQGYRLQYQRSLTEALAKARAERVMAEVEVAFLEAMETLLNRGTEGAATP